ncbi:MAG: ABC transporter ATP-binding protein, partial [Pseudorhodobacter sp.]|nr:ABC transporter ATP-binding protein [Pseudorhodobacter sp.]
VARFGAVLHVSGTDRAALEAVARAGIARGIHRWQKKDAELEEAFIYLMAGASDNFAEAGA